VSGHHADYSRRAGVRGELLAPYRVLASRVIALAVRDLVTYGHSASERDSARAFLSGSRMLTHWCELADIDPAAIRAQVRAFVDRKRPGIIIPDRRH
jgi:hypothetical protein